MTETQKKEKERREELRYTVLSYFEQLDVTYKYIAIKKMYDLTEQMKEERRRAEDIANGRNIVRMSDFKRKKGISPCQ